VGQEGARDQMKQRYQRRLVLRLLYESNAKCVEGMHRTAAVFREQNPRISFRSVPTSVNRVTVTAVTLSRWERKIF